MVISWYSQTVKIYFLLLSIPWIKTGNSASNVINQSKSYSSEAFSEGIHFSIYIFCLNFSTFFLIVLHSHCIFTILTWYLLLLHIYYPNFIFVTPCHCSFLIGFFCPVHWKLVKMSSFVCYMSAELHFCSLLFGMWSSLTALTWFSNCSWHALCSQPVYILCKYLSLYVKMQCNETHKTISIKSSAQTYHQVYIILLYIYHVVSMNEVTYSTRLMWKYVMYIYVAVLKQNLYAKYCTQQTRGAVQACFWLSVKAFIDSVCDHFHNKTL